MDYALKRRLRGSGPVFNLGMEINDRVKVKQRDAHRLVLEMLPIIEDIKRLLELTHVRGDVLQREMLFDIHCSWLLYFFFPGRPS